MNLDLVESQVELARQVLRAHLDDRVLVIAVPDEPEPHQTAHPCGMKVLARFPSWDTYYEISERGRTVRQLRQMLELPIEVSIAGDGWPCRLEPVGEVSQQAAAAATSATEAKGYGRLTVDGGIAGVTHHFDQPTGRWTRCRTCWGSVAR